MKSMRLLLKRKRTLAGLGILAGLFVLVSLVSSTVTGQAETAPATGPGTGSPAESPQDVQDPGIGGMTLKVLGSVLLLIGLLYAGVYGMRALSGRAGRGRLSSGAITVLHKSHIAPKKAIYVVKVGRKAMVVGVTESQINHLSDLSEDDLGSLKQPEKARARSFKQHLLGFALGGKERT